MTVTAPRGATPAMTCECRHREDRRPCSGPPVVYVQDAGGSRATGCKRHAATLLASTRGVAVYPVVQHSCEALRTYLLSQQRTPWDFTTPDGLEDWS